MVIKIIIAFLLVVVLGIAILNKKPYESFIKTYKEDVFLPTLAPFSFVLIDRLDFNNRLPKLMNIIHQKMIILKGSKLSAEHTRIYVSKIITIVTIGLILSLFVTIADGTDYSKMIYGLLLTGLIGFFLIKDLDKKVKQRKDAIIIELPEFVNKIILLVNAGETVQGAIQKCVQQNKGKIYDSPLYFELNEAVNKLTSNASFQDVLKDLNYRCGIQEVSIFTTTVMMNYRKGGALLVDSLKELSVSLWDKRKTITRIKGEEASAKLIFPIIFVFAAVLLIVIYPAIAVF